MNLATEYSMKKVRAKCYIEYDSIFITVQKLLKFFKRYFASIPIDAIKHEILGDGFLG